MPDVDWQAQPIRMLRVRALGEALARVRRRVPQRYRVLRLALQTPEGFTRWEAAERAGCFELASRVGELEAEGVQFDRTSYADTNRFGDRVRVMAYRLTYCPPAVRAHALGGDDE